ncbi:MAG TPA: pseudouridine synthase [Chitinophagaceae bacterium]|nr:pseudouridine synthase [Chitinophagaceae bacterium]
MKKKRTDNFSKFLPKKSNAAVKEQFKQEKRKVKKEREEYFDKKRAETRAQSAASGGQTDSRGKKIPAPVAISHPRPQDPGLMPLNKYISHAGICGRREAAEMVKKELVKVNGTVITEPGHKVSSKDEVRVNGKKIFLAKNLVYILLNKPKDYITTTEDPQGRKTVLDIIGRATTERVYPVGRLDRNTSGVLLLTNDGELAQKLTHPSNEIRKLYHVTLDKPLEKNDFERILKGVVLEDGPASVDVLAYADVKDKTQVGVEIHSGRNRIVRRIFEALGYDVKNLDRVIFAGLTKKNIERGKFRFLSEKEVRDLKHFGKGK